jgi:hypothetical protein
LKWILLAALYVQFSAESSLDVLQLVVR